MFFHIRLPIHYVFLYEVDYDEFVNEFYLHLMENDAYILKLFNGLSIIHQRMKVVAIRYFMAKRNTMIEEYSKTNTKKPKQALLC